jgi:xanthine dehydrogenase small subunit
MLPFLIAVGAEVALRLGEGIRSSAVEQFIANNRKNTLLPGEFIEQILVPWRRPDYVLRVYKVSKRREDDISSICGAFHMKIEDGMVCDARVAFGGMAEVTKRAEHCEAALQGQPWNQLTVGSAMQALEDDFTPISDLRASAGYRMQVAKNMLQRLFLQSDDLSSGPKVERLEN